MNVFRLAMAMLTFILFVPCAFPQVRRIKHEPFKRLAQPRIQRPIVVPRPRPRKLQLLRDQGVPEVMVRALQAAGQLRYTGTRVVEFKTGPDRMKHEEYIIHDGQLTRVEFPPDSPFHGQVIVESEKERRQYFPPPQNEIWILPARQVVNVSRLSGLIQNAKKKGFSLGVGPGTTIAGFATQQAYISDQQGNVVQRFYIEPRSGAVLRREIYDRSGSAVGWFEFTRINFNPNISPNDFQIVRKGAVLMTPFDSAKRLAQENGFTFVALAGSGEFHLESSRMMKNLRVPVLNQLYTGPKGRFSLFQTRAPIDPERLKRLARGDYRVHSWQRGNEYFAVVGDLPDATLRELARKLGDQ